MATFQYKAVLPNGVFVFGVTDADSKAGLEASLAARDMKLIEAVEMILDAAISTRTKDIPRLSQLRVGERIREALLTGMPAHEAVRAMADEPMEHPILMLMPWMFGFSLYLFLVTLILKLVISFVLPAVPMAAGLICLLVALIWAVSYFVLGKMPSRLLHQIAGQLERGQLQFQDATMLIPGELRAIRDSKLEREAQAVCIAELVPDVGGMRMVRHQLAARVLGPLVMAGALAIGTYIFLLVIVPRFTEMFAGFGVEMPWMTTQISQAGRLLEAAGTVGLLAFVGLTSSILILSYYCLTSDRMTALAEMIPFVGTSIRWLMQARIARILGVLLRNQPAPGEAIRIATKASGVPEVRDDGVRLAKALEEKTTNFNPGRLLWGLPLSLLIRLTQTQTDTETRQETAQVFTGVAASLENASSGHGSFLAVVMELFLIIVSGMFLSTIVVSLLLPLMKLLSDLSMIVWWP